jgi:hypothetical protein
VCQDRTLSKTSQSRFCRLHLEWNSWVPRIEVLNQFQWSNYHYQCVRNTVNIAGQVHHIHSNTKKNTFGFYRFGIILHLNQFGCNLRYVDLYIKMVRTRLKRCNKFVPRGHPSFCRDAWFTDAFSAIFSSETLELLAHACIGERIPRTHVARPRAGTNRGAAGTACAWHSPHGLHP